MSEINVTVDNVTKMVRIVESENELLHCENGDVSIDNENASVEFPFDRGMTLYEIENEIILMIISEEIIKLDYPTDIPKPERKMKIVGRKWKYCYKIKNDPDLTGQAFEICAEMSLGGIFREAGKITLYSEIIPSAYCDIHNAGICLQPVLCGTVIDAREIIAFGRKIVEIAEGIEARINRIESVTIRYQ